MAPFGAPFGAPNGWMAPFGAPFGAPGEHLRLADGRTTTLTRAEPISEQLPVYNLEVDGEHVYYVGTSGVLVHNTCPTQVSFGKNFDKKVRKHIDQVRNRGPVKDPIPSPSQGGAASVRKIITDRVAKGGGRRTTYAGEDAWAYEDGGVTYILRMNGEFWTILGN